MSDKPGPSWKHSGGQAARPATSRKAWQPGRAQATRAPADPRKKYRRRWVMASVSLAVLVGLIVAVILLINPPKTPTVIMVAPDAPDSTVVPFNATSSQAVQGLKGFAEKERLKDEQFRVYADPSPAADKWHEAIDNKSGPLVLHFSCPGAADRSEPFLWLVPADAGTADATHRLPVTSILSQLKSLPAKRPKLLILDAATEPVSWARGQFHNDFARRLKALDKDIKDVENLVVICSADEDQRSWVSEEWRQTAFGHYLQQGLRGAAVSPNTQLTAQALFNYLKEKVPQWAQSNRHVRQTPILLPSADAADPIRDGPTRAERLVLAPPVPDEFKDVAPDQAPGYSFTVPPVMRQEWTRRDDLQKLPTGPETKAPHVWRQYLDLLLRAEQIARITGDVPPAVQRKLKVLGDHLALPVWSAPLPCVPFSLPAGPALGYAPKEVTARKFQEVWDDPKPEEKWSALAGLEADRMRPAFGYAMIQHLLAEEPPTKETLTKAEKVLALVEDGRIRPVETHLVRIFQRFLAPGRDPKLVQLAIQVQIAAERAAWFTGPGSEYPYAEQVALWFSKDLAAADKHRRDGTDLVFAGDAQSAVTAREQLEAAREKYEDLARKAATLGAAYRVRDRVQTRLPYYARWAASLRVKDEPTNQLLALVEQTAGQAHALSSVLEKPDPQNLGLVNGLVKDLVSRDKPLGKFEQLETDFLASLSRLTDRALPANWHALDSALGVPFIPARTREELLGKLRIVSQGLHANVNPQDNTQLNEPVTARELAQRQGRMALAILGEDRLREFQGGPQPIAFARLQERLQLEVGDWQDPLAETSEKIAATFAALPRAAAASTETAAAAEPAKAETELARAARLARLVDGSTVLSPANPAALERKYWTQKLLIAQAERAVRDGWADIGAGSDQEYCMRAARAYLDSAQDVLLDGEKGISESERIRRTAAVKEARDRLRFAKFELGGGDRVYLTDRDKESLGYLVQPADGPNGYPVVRVAEITAPVEMREFPKNEFRPLSEFTKPRTDPWAGTFDMTVRGTDKPASGHVDLQLLYRGRLVSRKVEVVQAETTYHWLYKKSDAKASIAVKGEGALRTGAVAVLFDLSKSMEKLDGGTEMRQERAAKGVEAMLARLPVGTKVSLSFFSGPGSLRKMTPEPVQWNQPEKQAKDVHDAIIKQTLGGLTDLANSIVGVLDGEGFFPAKDEAGFRSLIIITDGSDTVTDGPDRPATSAPGQKVIDSLTNRVKRGFGDVAIHLVLFGGDNLNDAYTQFGAMAEAQSYTNREQSVPQIWPSKAEYKNNARLVRTDELAEKLKSAMLPVTTVLSYDKTIERRLPTSLGTGRDIAWLDPAVPEGIYSLVALGGTQQIQLRAGERFLLDLESARKGPKFTLPAFARAYGLTGVNYEPSTDRTVHLTVLRNSLTQPSNSYDLELTAALEKPITEPPSLLTRQLPMFAWFDVSPVDADKGKGPASIRMEFLHRQMAPAWAVKATRWVPQAGRTEVAIHPALAQVDAYWLDSEPPRNTLEHSRLKEKGYKLSVDGIDVAIDPEVTLKDGNLTIRLTHEPKRPVLVRVAIRGNSRRWDLNEEHKFFDTANKYTAVFGPIQEKDLHDLTFEFFSLATIKERSKKVPMELKQRPILNAKDQLPEPKLRD